MRGQPGLIRTVLAFALLLASLSLVVWRQSRALELLRTLEGVRREQTLLEGERAYLVGRIQRLESRGHVVSVATTELGLRIPVGAEIVVLPYGTGAGGWR